MEIEKQSDKLSFFERISIGTVASIAALIMLGLFSLYLIKFHNHLSNSQEVWGQFGDFMGGTLNPILGFITILILLSTMKIQRKELYEQRLVSSENNRILTAQLDAMRNQALEMTFFKVLEEIKNDKVIQKCLGTKSSYNIFLSVYMLEEAKKDGARTHSDLTVLFQKRTGLTLGEFRHVVLEKLILTAQLAAQIQNNNLHYKLIQTTLSPIIISAAIHHAKSYHKDGYEILKTARELLRGTHPKAIYNKEVAEDLLAGETKKAFYEGYDENEATRKKALQHYLEQHDKETSQAEQSDLAEAH
ncbi:MAG: hypothetical protein VR76_14785 [Pseudomonas sp. BRH_c35]|nr:MAG: hypothetical protein VR76_14785 [Pseudomonas sp. BRH_c35]